MPLHFLLLAPLLPNPLLLLRRVVLGQSLLMLPVPLPHQ